MAPEDRSSIDNGIWLCRHHHKLVDSDESRFSAEDLRTWKKQHENRASARLISGQPLAAISSSQVGVEVSAQTVGGGIFRDPHSEIDRACEYIVEGQPNVAIRELTVLRERDWDRLSARQKYRLVSGLAKARYQCGETAEAGRLFIAAGKHQPNDEDAGANVALGYFLLEDHERAHELAVEICAANPECGRAHMVRLRTDPEGTTLDEMLASVPSAARNDSEVRVALHEQAVEEMRLDEALQLLREETSDLNRWPVMTVAEGATLLAREIERRNASFTVDEGNIREAIDILTQALDAIPEMYDPEHLRFYAYFNRGLCFMLKGDYVSARSDFLRASKTRPEEERPVLELARLADFTEDFDEAIEVLETFLIREPGSIVAMLFLAETYLQRSRPGDAKKQQKLLESLRSRMNELQALHREIVATELVRSYLEAEEPSKALELEAEAVSSGHLRAFARHSLRCRIASWVGDTDEALAEAVSARTKLPDAPELHDVAQLASLFENLGDFGAGLDLWRRVVMPEEPNQVWVIRLLQCAYRVGEDSFILKFCQLRRDAGVLSYPVLHFEMRTLLKYNEFSKAREVMLQYLEANPDDKVLRLRLSLLALDQNWQELVEDNEYKLPSVEELKAPEVGLEVVVNLQRTGQRDLALDYAYRLFRRYPNEEAANRSLVRVVLQSGNGALYVEVPEVVSPGTAIGYRIADAPETQWLVIEDEPEPSRDRSEYSSSHLLAQALIGKRVGEEFRHVGGLRERVGVVVEIRDKKLYRAQQIISTWRDRFPNRFLVEEVGIGDDDSIDLSALEEIHRQIQEPREQLAEAYKQGKLPITTFAELANRSVFEIVEFAAYQPDFQVFSSYGRLQDRHKALAQLDSGQPLVLDPTVVATLCILDQTALLKKIPRCLVTEGTLQEIRGLVRREDRFSGEHVGYLTFRDGRLAIKEVDQRREEARRKRLRSNLDFVKQHCEIVGGGDLAEITDLTSRDRFAELVSRGSAEALAVAHRRGYVIWTDDQLFCDLVMTMVPTPRVWTQEVVAWLVTRDLLAGSVESHITAQLLQFGYRHTSLSSGMVLDMCEESSWSLDAIGLCAMLAEFGNLFWTRETALHVTVGTLRGVWRQAPSVEHARLITTRLLTHLAGRQDRRELLESLLHYCDGLLGLAFTRERLLKTTVLDMLRQGVPTIIPR